MLKIFIALIMMFAGFSFAYAEESELEPLQQESVIDNKALMLDEEYQLTGGIEYDNQNALFLDTAEINKIPIKVNTSKPFLTKSVLYDGISLSDINNVRTYHQNIANEYTISPIFGTTAYKTGPYTYGTSYSSGIDNAQVEHFTKLYSRYDNKRFAFSTVYARSGGMTTNDQTSNVSFIPELKLGRGFVLKDSLKYVHEYDKKSNQLSIQYRPLINNSREFVDIEASASQVLYHDGHSKYIFGFSTNFRL